MKAIILRNRLDGKPEAVFPDTVKGIKQAQQYAERMGGRDKYVVRRTEEVGDHMLKSLFENAKIFV